jgi:hypothetical protein
LRTGTFGAIGVYGSVSGEALSSYGAVSGARGHIVGDPDGSGVDLTTGGTVTNARAFPHGNGGNFTIRIHP